MKEQLVTNSNFVLFLYGAEIDTTVFKFIIKINTKFEL